MEIESSIDNKESEDKIAQRLAILNRCLTANELVECKPISTQIKQIIEVRKSDDFRQSIHKDILPIEIYLTNFRILLIIYLKNGHYDERSIFFSNTSEFNIMVPKIVDPMKTSLMQYLTENGTIQLNIFLDRLCNTDEKIIKDFYEKNKNTKPNIPLEIIVQKQILERDQKLQNFYQLVVLNKKVLSEAQFWKNHEGYQNFLKYKERDEEKIKRDYIEKEIPLINQEFKPDINIEMQDERINRFDKFRKEIYDPNSLIENQNLKSFQSYKQEVYFYGKIDSLIQRLEQEKQLNSSAMKDEDVKIDDSNPFQHHQQNHHYHLEIEEHSLETTRSDSKKHQSQEIKKEEFQIKIKMNPDLEKQKKLDAFIQNQIKLSSNTKSKLLLKEFKEGDLKKLDPSKPEYKDQAKEALTKVAKRVQGAWKQAFEGLYKLKPLPSSAQNSQIAKKSNDIYYEKFYQLREILRWLYKEKNNGDKARPEVIEKLKSELEQIRNSINEILKALNEGEKKESGNNDDPSKKVNQQQKERLQDLLDSFLFKQSSM